MSIKNITKDAEITVADDAPVLLHGEPIGKVTEVIESEQGLDIRFQIDPEAEEVLRALSGLDKPIALPEPETDGPIALMERGWVLLVAAHGGNITLALRSWRELARQWREDCLDWAEANPTADN